MFLFPPKIVEAMPHTAMVQDFVQKLDNFYELTDAKPKSSKLNGNVVSNGNDDHSGSDDDVTRSFQGQPEEGETSQEEVVTTETKPVKQNSSQGN